MAEDIDWLALRRIKLFADFTKTELQILFRSAFIKTYAEDMPLFNEGMSGQTFYVIKSGQVGIFKKTADGEQVLAKLGPGEFFGELAIIDGAQRTASARTLKASDIIAIPKKAFDDMLQVDPRVTSKILLQLLQVYAQRLRAANQTIS